MKDKINLSYSFGVPATSDARVGLCDIVFIYKYKDEVPDTFFDGLSENVKVYAIGDKNYGQCIGQHYIRRYRKDYFSTSTRVAPLHEERNTVMKEQWGEYYIDLLGYVRNEDNTVRVFTDDYKYISHDCRHLSRAGAQFYARVIDFESIFGEVYERN